MTDLDRTLAALRIAAERKKNEAWRFFQPYPKQSLFLSLGATHSERLLMAGNQLGKSECGAYEVARHLSGEYPPWWKGRRWDRPVKIWAGGVSGRDVRDIQQGKLFGQPGDPEAFGTGQVPKAAIAKTTAGRSAPDAFDTAFVKHKSGGTSTIQFKTYEQGRESWQGTTIDMVWFDEEPDIAVYVEGRTRLTATRGMSILTFTPLKGISEVVTRFYPHPQNSDDQAFVKMGIVDAGHIAEEDRQKIIMGYPAHQRKARAEGEPYLGSGVIFATPIDDLLEDPIEMVPPEWVKLWALDFGIDHPFAAVLIAWDRDRDVIHVLEAIRMTGAIPLQHAAAMRRVAANVPVAWPHDGHKRDAGSGIALAPQYRKEGLNMLSTHATHPSGGYSTEAGIMEMDRYMQARRFKINRNLGEWINEYGMYHRDDKGQIVKKNDDLLSATRIAVMQRRSAKAVPLGSKKLVRRQMFADGVEQDVWGA